MRSKELWLVQENHATIKLDWKHASHGMKPYSGSRIELRNLQVLKKMLENQVSFCHQSSCVSLKAWKFPWILQEFKNTLWKLAVAVNTWSHSVLVTVEISVLCVGDSQISLIYGRRHLIAAIQVAVCCNELYFARCCVLKRTGTFAAESIVMCLS